MRTQLNRNGRVSLPTTLTAILAVAITFTLSCSGSDDPDNGNDPNNPGGKDPLSGIPGYEYMKEGAKYYDPDDERQRCQNGVVELFCEDYYGGSDGLWFNPMTHYCDQGHYSGNCSDCDIVYGTFQAKAIERCGNEYIRDVWHRCQGGVVEERCEKCREIVWYNPKTHYMGSDGSDNGRTIYIIKAKLPCGSEYYAPEYQNERCQNGVVEEECGWGENVWFNPKTHLCYWGESGGQVKVKEYCGNSGRYIEDSYERCNGGIYEWKCGDNWYSPIKQSCDWDIGTVKNQVRCGN
jgi:hypothetical protein